MRYKEEEEGAANWSKVNLIYLLYQIDFIAIDRYYFIYKVIFIYKDIYL